MEKRFTLFILLILSGFGGIKAQDIHYSMFQMSPLGLNPSLAGSFSGTSRVGAIYRIQDVIGSDSREDQMSSSIGYNTFSFYIDAPIIRGFREQDWIGIGLGLTNDVAGIGRLRETTTVQAISYHIPLDKDNRRVFSIGINSGTLSYRGQNTFQFEDQILGTGNQDANFFSLPSGGGAGGRGNTIVDWGVGLSYKGYIDRVSAVRLGTSGAHLTRPIKRLGESGGGERFPIRFNFFAEYDRLLNPRTRIIPAVYFQNYRNNNEVAFQALMAYYLNPVKDITVYGGLGARVNTFNPFDAVPVYFGFDIGDLQARLAYDFTISGKSYTNRGFGALELSVNYIIKIYKRPKVDPAVFCPRF